MLDLHFHVSCRMNLVALTECYSLVELDIVGFKKEDHLRFVHVEVLSSHVHKNGSLKPIRQFALRPLHLARVQHLVLLHKVKVQHRLFTRVAWASSYGALHFEQVVQLSEVFEVYFFAGVDDCVDFK